MSVVPSVSLCMIVRDEETWVGKAIRSARALVSEIVVVDTGSRDNTAKEALAEGAKIFDFQWNDDFAAARNFSLKKATREWILVLDADETLDEEGVAKIGQWLSNPKTDQALLVQTTYTYNSHHMMWVPNKLKGSESENYPGYIESSLIRLFRNEASLYFEGRLHENIVSHRMPPTDPDKLDVRIHHYGQVREASGRNKQDLYLRIARKKMMENPSDAKAAFEYGVSSWESGKSNEAIEGFTKAISLYPTHVPSLSSLAMLEVQESHLEEAVDLYKRALAVKPDHAASAIGLSDVYLTQGRHEEAGYVLEQILQRHPEHAEVLKKIGIYYGKTNREELGLEYLKKSLVRNTRDGLTYLNIGLILMGLGRADEAAEAFKEGWLKIDRAPWYKEQMKKVYDYFGSEMPKSFKEEIVL